MDELWPGGPVFRQVPGVFPLGTDALLLSAFARGGDRERILDLGTGSGILTLLLLWQRPGATATALEQSETACRAAEENLRENGLLDRAEVILGDLRDHRTLLPPGGADRAVCNPPYFDPNAGAVAAGERGQARSELGASIGEVCRAAAWAVRWGGALDLCYRPERLPELLSALGENGFSPKRLRPVHHSPGRPANLLLVEARRGGKPGLKWEPDLYLRDETGAETPEVRRIYHRKEQG